MDAFWSSIKSAVTAIIRLFLSGIAGDKPAVTVVAYAVQRYQAASWGKDHKRSES